MIAIRDRRIETAQIRREKLKRKRVLKMKRKNQLEKEMELKKRNQMRPKPKVEYIGACIVNLVSCTSSGHGVVFGFRFKDVEYFCLFDDKRSIYSPGHSKEVKIAFSFRDYIKLDPVSFRIQTHDFYLCRVKADTPEKVQKLKSRMSLFLNNAKKEIVYHINYTNKLQQTEMTNFNSINNGSVLNACFENNRFVGFQNVCGKLVNLTDINYILTSEIYHIDDHGKHHTFFKRRLYELFNQKVI